MQSLETRARDWDRNPSRPRRDLRLSRPRLQKKGLETRLETPSLAERSMKCSKNSILNFLHLFCCSLRRCLETAPMPYH